MLRIIFDKFYETGFAWNVKRYKLFDYCIQFYWFILKHVIDNLIKIKTMHFIKYREII